MKDNREKLYDSIYDVIEKRVIKICNLDTYILETYEVKEITKSWTLDLVEKTIINNNINSIINQLSTESKKAILAIKLTKNKSELHYNLIDLLNSYLMQFNNINNEMINQK